MLYEGRVIGFFEIRGNVHVERGDQHVRNDLLSLDIVRDVSLHDNQQYERGQLHAPLTRSLAPRFKKRAPAKNRERLAIMVM